MDHMDLPRYLRPLVEDIVRSPNPQATAEWMVGRAVKAGMSEEIVRALRKLLYALVTYRHVVFKDEGGRTSLALSRFFFGANLRPI
jgi:hypothetical protein